MLVTLLKVFLLIQPYVAMLVDADLFVGSCNNFRVHFYFDSHAWVMGIIEQ
jgi:hypothetical protein